MGQSPFGAKISKENNEVITSALGGLILHSDYGMLKAALMGSIFVTAGVTAQIAHNLGYAPLFQTWMQGNTYRFKTPRLYDGAPDPVGGGVQAFAESDSTYLYISTSQNATVYYYIFVDPLI